MNIIFVVLLSVLTISNSEFLLGSRSNSSLITVAEFRELVDLISEEKQLRHALEHNVATLQQKLTSNEAAYKQLQNDYRNLTTAYNSLKVSNDDLQRQFVDMKSTNQSIQRFLTSNTADLSNLKRKAGYESAFTGWYPTSGTKSGTIKFGTVLTNIGSDYDTASGNFTCEHPGIYMFHFHLYRYPTSSYSNAQCYIQKNYSNQIIAYSSPYSSARGYYYQSSNSLVVHLNHGDVITLGGCTAIGSIYSYTSLTGFLVKPD